MSTSRTETLPATWDDARDEPFFRITSRLFSPQFCEGATVLLGSNDDEPVAARRALPAPCPGPSAVPAPAHLPVRRA